MIKVTRAKCIEEILVFLLLFIFFLGYICEEFYFYFFGDEVMS